MLSLEKSKDKEGSEGMTDDLANKDENSIEKKDQSTDIVNIEDLDSGDVPIGQRLPLGITKRLKNRKGQAIESSNTPSKYLKKRASVGPINRWKKVVTPVSKKKSLKRKEDIVSTARKQASGKKIPTNIHEVPIDIISFHYVENVEKWKFVYQRRLTLERELSKDAFECKEVMSLIQEAGLMKTVTGFWGRNEEEQAEVEVSDNFICREITAKQVKEWPRKGKLFARTKSSFDFGSYVFDQTMKHVASYDVKMPITFPSLICGVILSQHPSIFISSDSICKRDPPLSLHYRLFTGKHVPNIVMTSGHTSSRPTTRTWILAELKDTCKTLDETIKSCTERKIKIEILIKALSEEGGILKGDGIGEEEANE
ncbi:uncharacterized protein LOC127104572 [Lathyrus oleraceus]|uniref:uncharacterized protein LOC127104572 n=1 Tax=Pisum sativum TaxID=3888 RepID=UPI0021CE7002|nr:uncharacterized protein LOC127104572 [Pisum sativum]